MNDNGSDNGSGAIAVQPPHRDGGANLNPFIPEGIENSARRSNYCVVARWEYRSTMWTDHTDAYQNATMNALQEPPELPTKQDFLLSDDPDRAEIKHSFESWIWGDHEGSLESLYPSLQNLLALLAELLVEQEPFEASLQSQVRNLSRELAALESMSIHEEETPANSNMMSSEQLEIQRLKKDLHKRTQGQIDAIQGQIDAIQGQIDAIQGQIMARRGRIDAIQGQIMARRGRIDAIQGQVTERLERIKDNRIALRRSLRWLAEKGNETAGGGSIRISDPNEGRIDASPPELTPIPEDDIFDAEPDSAFLSDLLGKENIQNHVGELEEFQKFVLELQECAQTYKKFSPKTDAKQKEKQDKKIKATVNAILGWERGQTVESHGQLKGRFAFPPIGGCETSADQPILGAIICRMFTIIGDSSLSLSSEQVVPSETKQGRGRRIDFVVDEYKEFLNVIYPEMLGTVIEVKTVKENDDIHVHTNQRKGREQVLGHQAKQLYCTSTFGGIGLVGIAWGIVVSLKSIQVLAMELVTDQDGVLKLRFRQTKQVLFLDKDGNRDGFVLLASALLEVRKESAFGSGGGLSIEDTIARDRCTIQSLLGSGGFAHVIKLDDNEFMKIPRSPRMEKSLEEECKILQMLNGGDNRGIPRTMPWGISEVKLTIGNEISEMKVLRLTGIVGHSLDKSGLFQSQAADDHVHGVIKRVYHALEYAHGKGVFHMDVRPSNIIVKWNVNDEWDVLLSDWGCAMLGATVIKKNGFVGCPPYAHDYLLESHGELTPKADFDFASLGYTWYYVINKKLDWHFDRPVVPSEKLEDRQTMMASFFEDIGNDTAAMVPKVRDLFPVRRPVRAVKRRRWQGCFGGVSK